MTKVWVSWDPLLPILPMTVLGAIILALLIILERRRRQRFQSLRIVLQVIIVVSLLGLVMRPQFPFHKKDQGILLLTEGFQQPIADSLIKSSPGLKIIQTRKSDEYPDAARLESFNDLTVIGADIEFILGEGLPHYALELMIKKKYRYFPAPTPEGIIGLDYPRKYYANRWNKVNGAYHQVSNPHKLMLVGPGGTDDSITMNGKGIIPFSISFFPKTTGNMLYQLIDQDTLSKEKKVNPLPLEVLPEKKLSIIFINNYPTFEQRYLKNFLSANGHALAVRNQISRGRYRYEFANQPARNIGALTDLLLLKTDLLIIDSPSYESLSGAEQRAIELAIDNGLGLLMIPGHLYAQEKTSQKLLGWKVLKNQGDTASFSLQGSGSFTLPVLPLSVQKRHSPMLLGNDGKVLSGFLFSTAGKIGFQFLLETFQLGLKGKKEAYASIWVPLLEALAREIQTPNKLIIRTRFPWVENEPISLEMISTGEEPVLFADSVRVPLIEDLHIDGLWYGRVWLEGNKWHRLRLDTVEYYLPLVASQDWSSIRIASQINANHIGQGARDETPNSVDAVLEDGIVPVVLFVLFLMASGLLWLVPKW